MWIEFWKRLISNSCSTVVAHGDGVRSDANQDVLGGAGLLI